MMNNIFIRSLPVVAMAMGNKMGVKVCIQGNQAMTDGNTIYLPVLPEGDETTWILARGYLDHEAGHVRHTDFSVREDSPIHKALTNILEDIRIEQAMGQAYPGCAVNLRNLAEHLARQGAFTPSASKPEQLFLGWILATCRSRVLQQQALLSIAEKTRKSLINRLGHGLVNQAEALLKSVGELSTTRQSHDLAQKILDLLRQTKRQTPSPSPPTSGVEGGGEPKTDRPGNSKPGQDKEDNTSGPCTSPASIREVLKRILERDPGSFGDLGQMTADALHEASDQAVRENGMETLTGIYPGEQPASDVTCGDPPDLAQVRHETVALRSKLARLVQASKLKRSCPGRVGHLVDHHSLHRLPTGDSRIFRRKENKKAVNTAVIILLDRSGSMSGERLDLAGKSVLALADILGTIPGISVSTGAFPGTNNGVVLMTPFGRTASQTRENYAITANGGTPLAQALGWARVQMAVRQESRKIVLVATDGQPSNPDLVMAFLERLEAEGVEMMGLGILDRGEGSRYFPRHRTVQSLNELPVAVFGLFQEALTER